MAALVFILPLPSQPSLGCRSCPCPAWEPIQRPSSGHAATACSGTPHPHHRPARSASPLHLATFSPISMVVCPNPIPFQSFVLIHYIFSLFSRNNELASSSDTKLILAPEVGSLHHHAYVHGLLTTAHSGRGRVTMSNSRISNLTVDSSKENSKNKKVLP